MWTRFQMLKPETMLKYIIWFVIVILNPDWYTLVWIQKVIVMNFSFRKNHPRLNHLDKKLWTKYSKFKNQDKYVVTRILSRFVLHHSVYLSKLATSLRNCFASYGAKINRIMWFFFRIGLVMEKKCFCDRDIFVHSLYLF